MCANHSVAEEEKPPHGLGLKIVSVAPTRYSSRAVSMKKQGGTQPSDKQPCQGVDISYIGEPLGLDRYPLLPNVKALESQCSVLLQSLQAEFDARPPLIKFFPVKESQLVTDGAQLSFYPRSVSLQGQELVYKLYHAEGRLVRSILEQAGFTLTESHDWNVMWTGTVPPRYLFEGLSEYQKINHFPRSEELTRKDRLYVNVSKMREKFGRDVFDFLPETYLLPEEFSEFSGRFQEAQDVAWIAKPHASSQGKGIFIVESLADAIVSEQFVVSRYISNPLLIDNLKFDLRVYVLVTSYDPLRIYLYEEGLARFASEEYQPAASKKNRFVHLTNYSVNKKNEKYVQNQDFRKDNIGHKWSLSALFQRLRVLNIDTELLWTKIYDAVIKSVISIEELVIEASGDSGINRNNCFDLFGFDILIDSALKPWVLEVNLSPSLATDSPLDLHIKGHLIADTFNLVGIRGFDRRKESINKTRARLRAKRSLSGRPAPSKGGSKEGGVWKLKDVVRDTAEEFARRGHFLRIYPSKGCDSYEGFFAGQRMANRYINRLLFTDPDLLSKEQPDLPPHPTPRPQTSLLSSASERRVENTDFQQKTYSHESRPGSVASVKRGLSASSIRRMPFSEEEVVVEYTSRLTAALGKVGDKAVQGLWKRTLEAFLTNALWVNSDLPSEPLTKRVENRLTEMKERRLKTSKGSGRPPAVPTQLTLTSFSNGHIEEFLRRMPAGYARDLVYPLLRRHSGGLLSELTHPQQRSHTLSQLQSLPPHSDEEEESPTPLDPRKQSLDHIPTVSTLRPTLKPRPVTRKIVRSIKK